MLHLLKLRLSLASVLCDHFLTPISHERENRQLPRPGSLKVPSKPEIFSDPFKMHASPARSHVSNSY